MTTTIPVADSVAFESAPGLPAASAPAPAGRLSGRERQLVALVTQAYSNKEIAVSLGLELQTVKNHLSRIYRKIGVRSRVELAVSAVRDGSAGR
jgi:DNA-binding NarL/FixJ family response regulator